MYRHMPEAGDADLSQSGEQPLTAPPAEFHLVWRSTGRTPVTLWEPVPTPGYRALGTVATPALEVPTQHDVLCVREDTCRPAAVFDSAAWRWEPPAVRRPPLPAVVLHILPCVWPLCALCGQVQFTYFVPEGHLLLALPLWLPTCLSESYLHSASLYIGAAYSIGCNCISCQSLDSRCSDQRPC